MKQAQPFIPLAVDDNKQYDIKNVLQKQIKQLKPEEYHFFSFLIATNHVFEQLTNCQNKLNNDPTFSLWKLFEFFDVNGDRKLQLDDFIITLQKLDILLKREEIESLFSTLGGEDDNIISYAEFANLFKFSSTPQWRQSKLPSEGVLNQDQQKLIHQIFSLYAKMERSILHLRTQIGSDIQQLENFFRKLDQKQKGYLILNDIITYVKSMGVQVKGNDYYRVFFMLQQYKSGRISFNEFLKRFSTKEAYNNYLQLLDLLIHPPQLAQRQTIEQQQAVLQTKIEYTTNLESKHIQQNEIQSKISQQSRFSQDLDDSIRLPGYTRYIFGNN
ncbi:unnamed protein product [Paramecium primaurelia]|uniref:EF-hand domain-containing protein n=1 Tax=Paramecium primaurelia TaxID=5886 RepID=A0A8S1LMR5_PARPR|nr:unnamed protein product [Paramecium primaurelia]